MLHPDCTPYPLVPLTLSNEKLIILCHTMSVGRLPLFMSFTQEVPKPLPVSHSALPTLRECSCTSSTDTHDPTAMPAAGCVQGDESPKLV